jgi:hypothetical protein
MKRTLACLLLLFPCSAWAAPPRRKRAPPPTVASAGIDVTVVDVAGSQAWIKPGEQGNVRRGSKVTIEGRTYIVVATTSSYAVIDVESRAIRQGAKGSATIEEAREEPATRLPEPRPQAAFAALWPEPVAPASTQRPTPVPLGETARDSRWDARLMMLGGASIPLGGRGEGIGRAEIQARVHAVPFAAPLTFDLDASIQRWFGPGLDTRDGRPARPLLRVRELLASYGTTTGVSLGRMRWAAGTLGALDGVRVKAGLGGGFGVSAFGGVLPNPLSTAPELGAQRFGVEGSFALPDRTLHPEASLVVHGSTFDGRLDERRMSGIFGIYPGRSRLGGHVEVSSFDRDNPWGASTIELTAAGLDGSLRIGRVQVGARADIRQPERSRWLASFLPASFFCLTRPSAPGAPAVPEACDGRVATRAHGALDASVDVGPVVLAAGGSVVRDLAIERLPTLASGFGSARVIRVARYLRADLTGSYSSSSYVDMLMVGGGPGVSLLGDRIDIGTYARFAKLSYPVRTGDLAQRAAGGTVMVLPSPVLAFTLQGEGVTGDDARAVLVFASALWHPRF